MKEEKNEKWLDEIISRVINTTKPQFDAEEWKQKYPEEFQILKSPAGQDSQIYQPKVWRLIVKSPITKITAAAVIIAAIGVFVFSRRPVEQIEPPEVLGVSKSPADLLTMASLGAAYRRGGIAEVEKQCDEAVRMLGPRPAEITVKELLSEFNGT